MLKRFVATIICGACAVAALTSCGNSKAGGTGEFTTVYASATTPGADVDADVANWVDSTGAKTTACASGALATVTPNVANYSITSTAYATASTGQTNPTIASDLVIDKITLTFTPANSNAPSLAAGFQTQYPTTGQRIAAGTTVTIPVIVATDAMKNYLRTTVLPQPLDCSALGQSSVFTYRVVASFEALEVNTNRVGTITPPGFLLVNFADFKDQQ